MVKDLIMTKIGKKIMFEESDKVKARALPASRAATFTKFCKRLHEFQ